LLIGQRDARTGIPLTGLARWLASVADSGSARGGQGWIRRRGQKSGIAISGHSFQRLRCPL